MNSQPTTGLPLRIALKVESFFDGLTTRFRKPPDSDQRLHVIAYYGFGNSIHAQLSGRVLLKKERAVRSSIGRRNNLRNNYANFDTDELAGICVHGQFGDCKSIAVSDEEGYFTLSFDASDTPLGKHQLFEMSGGLSAHPVDLKLPNFPNSHIDGNAAIMLPTNSARFGIISDVDDTLMITQATSLLRMLKLTLLESAHSRVAYSGIAEFYSALHDQCNPFFYVSSSPWNLYSFLVEFMRLRSIVAGPIMLRDFGLDKTKFMAGSHTDHKLVQIRRVLDCYPELQFILSGDSGQDDPKIYAQIAEEYSGRIKAIYIRDVGSENGRIKVHDLATQLATQHIDMLLVANTLEAATHAASLGFISSDALGKISQI